METYVGALLNTPKLTISFVTHDITIRYNNYYRFDMLSLFLGSYFCIAFVDLSEKATGALVYLSWRINLFHAHVPKFQVA